MLSLSCVYVFFDSQEDRRVQVKGQTHDTLNVNVCVRAKEKLLMFPHQCFEAFTSVTLWGGGGLIVSMETTQ